MDQRDIGHLRLDAACRQLVVGGLQGLLQRRLDALAGSLHGQGLVLDRRDDGARAQRTHGGGVGGQRGPGRAAAVVLDRHHGGAAATVEVLLAHPVAVADGAEHGEVHARGDGQPAAVHGVRAGDDDQVAGLGVLSHEPLHGVDVLLTARPAGHQHDVAPLHRLLRRDDRQALDLGAGRQPALRVGADPDVDPAVAQVERVRRGDGVEAQHSHLAVLEQGQVGAVRVEGRHGA
ncbi:hypothetical protein BJF80_13385 [Serinicoccus sp. CUA-874]|nr:hypothetical protein BJF80_13385 [Serinicoccus sp. CUA-874]